MKASKARLRSSAFSPRTISSSFARRSSGDPSDALAGFSARSERETLRDEGPVESEPESADDPRDKRDSEILDVSAVPPGFEEIRPAMKPPAPMTRSAAKVVIDEGFMIR